MECITFEQLQSEGSLCQDSNKFFIAIVVAIFELEKEFCYALLRDINKDYAVVRYHSMYIKISTGTVYRFDGGFQAAINITKESLLIVFNQTSSVQDIGEGELTHEELSLLRMPNDTIEKSITKLNDLVYVPCTKDIFYDYYENGIKRTIISGLFKIVKIEETKKGKGNTRQPDVTVTLSQGTEMTIHNRRFAIQMPLWQRHKYIGFKEYEIIQITNSRAKYDIIEKVITLYPHHSSVSLIETANEMSKVENHYNDLRLTRVFAVPNSKKDERLRRTGTELVDLSFLLYQDKFTTIKKNLTATPIMLGKIIPDEFMKTSKTTVGGLNAMIKCKDRKFFFNVTVLVDRIMEMAVFSEENMDTEEELISTRGEHWENYDDGQLTDQELLSILQ